MHVRTRLNSSSLLMAIQCINNLHCTPKDIVHVLAFESLLSLLTYFQVSGTRSLQRLYGGRLWPQALRLSNLIDRARRRKAPASPCGKLRVPASAKQRERYFPFSRRYARDHTVNEYHAVFAE